MENKGVLLQVLLMVCLVSHSTQEALQEVMQASHGLHRPVADAIEQLAAEGKQWLASVQEGQQLHQDSEEKQQDTENSEQDEGRIERQDQLGLEQQLQQQQQQKDNHRTGRMLTEATKKKEQAAGRIFFGDGTSDQNITVSLPGLLSGIFIAVAALLFFKVVAAIITGRDLSYWTNWANRFINPPQYHPTYHTDHSTYTAYRALEEVPEKYQ